MAFDRLSSSPLAAARGAAATLVGLLALTSGCEVLVGADFGVEDGRGANGGGGSGTNATNGPVGPGAGAGSSASASGGGGAGSGGDPQGGGGAGASGASGPSSTSTGAGLACPASCPDCSTLFGRAFSLGADVAGHDVDLAPCGRVAIAGDSGGDALVQLFESDGSPAWTLHASSPAAPPSQSRADAVLFGEPGATGLAPVFAAGTFNTPMTLGGTTYTTSEPDGWITLLAPTTGMPSWFQQLSGTGTAEVNDIALRGMGTSAAIVAAGYCVGDNQLANALVTCPDNDVFLAEYDADTGTPLRNFHPAAAGTQTASAIAINGDVAYIAGRYEGDTSFLGAPSAVGPTSLLGSQLGFVASISLVAGQIQPQWVRGFGGSTGASAIFGRGDAVALASNGDVLVAGAIQGSDPTTGHVSVGKSDALVARWRPNGNLAWAVSFGSVDEDFARGVTVLANGHVVVSGTFSGPISIGPVQLQSSGQAAFFLVELDALGKAVRGRAFEGTPWPGLEAFPLIRVASAGDVVATQAAATNAAVDFVPGQPAPTQPTLYVAKLFELEAP